MTILVNLAFNGIMKWSAVAQSCPTLCNPMDCSLPGSIHEIFQARILEWVAISFSRGSSRPRDRTRVSCIAGRCFTVWATRETPMVSWFSLKTYFEIQNIIDLDCILDNYMVQLKKKKTALWLGRVNELFNYYMLSITM